jgi:hypothetical protein
VNSIDSYRISNPTFFLRFSYNPKSPRPGAYRQPALAGAGAGAGPAPGSEPS